MREFVDIVVEKKKVLLCWFVDSDMVKSQKYKAFSLTYPLKCP